MHDPLLQLPRIVAFHELKAALESRVDPAVYAFETAGHLPPVVAEAAIYRLRISAVA